MADVVADDAGAAASDNIGELNLRVLVKWAAEVGFLEPPRDERLAAVGQDGFLEDFHRMQVSGNTEFFGFQRSRVASDPEFSKHLRSRQGAKATLLRFDRIRSMNASLGFEQQNTDNEHHSRSKNNIHFSRISENAHLFSLP
jgi:hypothetical protein